MEWWKDDGKRAEVLVRRRRIRRLHALPYELSGLEHPELKTPLRLDLADYPFEVRYRMPRWANYIDAEEDELQARTIVAWIYDGAERVGGIEIVQFRPDCFIENHMLFDLMDGCSSADGALAGMLCENWRDVGEQVAAYGAITEIRTIWTQPRSGAEGAWIRPVKELLRRIERGGSILVSQCFPLEYNGLAPEFAPSRIGFMRRQAAMFRGASRLLHLERLPGYWGEKGWMWRPMRGLLSIVAPTPGAGETD